ncbi:MAG: hypothetical protein K5643_01225 [Saccharofermentans sp.]|nr:hypothetical protein [Saccharofermentans sp.]
MREFNKATKIGFGIMLTALIVMAVFVIISKPVPDPVAWVFFAGMITSIASAFFVKKADQV